MLYCQFIVVPESKDVCYHNRLRGRRAKGQSISLIRVSKGTYLLVSVLISTSRSSAPCAKQSPVRTNQAITLAIAIQYYWAPAQSSWIWDPNWRVSAPVVFILSVPEMLMASTAVWNHVSTQTRAPDDLSPAGKEISETATPPFQVRNIGLDFVCRAGRTSRELSATLLIGAN